MKFQKILSYDVYGSDHTSRFNYVCSLLNQTTDPDTLEPKKIIGEAKAVFISPRKRALTCLNQDRAISITILPELNEIPFDLKLGCTAAEFQTHGSLAVRRAFLELFVTNKLGLSHKILKAELDYLLELSAKNTEALAISHTFRLRLLETYHQTDRQLFAEPALIKKYLDPTVHWADFGSFIDINTANLK